ncbi:MAG: bifunctional demethylmenaquinone methyltransferase/2-methoxy-6-polyprenyl-1,4-benzoquinol methylase UbiE [Gammaproteobacteria bacterium]|nr:bifunctional demethylmenaquinone methyltransferase/2-methoxy-6-polyprenyl-1,4-benzoquinol methylase UbiE [Gammaproteobacteria bacterium]
MSTMNKQDTTDFGFNEVPVNEKTQRVREVFASVAEQYDLMNDLMSFGMHRLWKRWAINVCQARTGYRVLDLAGGTGDLTALLSPIVGETGEVVLADINAAMLKVGFERLLNRGAINNVQVVQTNAETLSFSDNYFDRIIIGFGLRNVTDKNKALRSMYRVLKPGGRLMVLEFSKPTAPGLKPFYDWYSFNILPRLGQAIAKDSASYQYLAESIRRHPDQKTLTEMLQTAGFDRCDYHNLTGGIVAIHRGFKF